MTSVQSTLESWGKSILMHADGKSPASTGKVKKTTVQLTVLEESTDRYGSLRGERTKSVRWVVSEPGFRGVDGKGRSDTWMSELLPRR